MDSGLFSDLETLSQNFEDLLLDENSKDFTIEIESEKPIYLRCHKAILNCRSDYFKALFRSKMIESQQGKVVLHDTSKEMMEKFLKYIYTGKIEINEENAVEILISSRKFCLDQISEFAAKFIKQRITTQNVVEVYQISNQFLCEDVADFCFKYIEDKIQLLLETDLLYSLTEQEMEKLLKSENIFITREYRLFDLLLHWAQSQIGCPISSEIDPLYLDQIQKKISHLVQFIHFSEIEKDKFLEIKSKNLLSKDMIDKIEELHLQMDRETNQDPNQNVIPFPVTEIADIYLTPRIKQIPSKIITKNQNMIKSLKNWINNPEFFEKMKLGFSLSKTENDATKFHEICDDKGPTLVLIQSKNGNIFGGFTSVGWKSSVGNNYIEDENAFIFTLTNQSNLPQKFDLKPFEKNYAIRYYSNLGPLFGRGYDFGIKTNLKRGYSNFGYSYNLPEGIDLGSDQAKSFLGGSYSFVVRKLEIFFL
ncbi:pep-cterm sorting domain-containing protein [Anaeramoeba ignava]|uniref:Pep-cterm sorting domain-containing protein n=1 Tax=Anaeramoeba ignava TaxID=1746090 RepID=A0A9Q0LHU2_ANAIG|nr:pep-cterm sorting domain-containing protein [Anaeramoeba ignava]